MAESILERRVEPRWVLAERPSLEALEKAQMQLNIPPVIAQILIQRGMQNVEAARHFLYPALEQLVDPFVMADMDCAVDRVWAAIDAGEKILIHGDYDVDGVTGTSVLMRSLSALGADVGFYIPHRIEDGYGISKQGIDEGVERGVQLLISVDCGITAVDETAYARTRGVDVVITDHHQPVDLPPAVAVVNPKRSDCPYPFKELPGVGLAYKLAEAVYRRRGLDLNPVNNLLDLVALGCAADIVPLVWENRVLVTQGLKLMQRTCNLGLKALFKSANVDSRSLNTGQLVFVVAPRINALGRMGSAMDAVTLLTTEDEDEAQRIAQVLETQNLKRRKLDTSMLDEALAQVEAQVDPYQDRAVVLASDSWHPGVIGIVATRIAEKVHLPTVLISVDGASSKGSARSIPGFDLYAALSKCREHLVAFGGHKYAAGLTIDVQKITAFREQFLSVVDDAIDSEDLVPRIYIESEMALDKIDSHLVNALGRFAPFGAQNRQPIMASRNVEVVGAPAQVGRNHLRFKARQNGRVFDCIGFNLGDLSYRLSPGEANLDIAYMIEENEWRGRKQIQLRIIDLR